MKGLSETLWLVMVAVVIVIVALVILTIFMSVIPLFGSVTEFTNYCTTKGRTTCSSMNALPPDWDFEVNVGGEKKTCVSVTGFETCPAQWTGQTQ